LKRSLLCLLLLGALAACKEEPPGQLKPIPRPSGYQDPPKAEAAKAASTPPNDPNKVVLRWKLAAGAPMAFRLEGTPSSAGTPLKAVYALLRPDKGDSVVRIARQSPKAPPEQATFSERGFILDGLSEVDRNLATLLLELPKDPVGVGDSWALGTDLVNMEPLGKGFVVKKSDRRNSVKLGSLTAEGDEQVATIVYDVSELVSGNLQPGAKLPKGSGETAPIKVAAEKSKSKSKSKGKKKEAPAPAETQPKSATEIVSEVTFKGTGQFLVKAGRWRSWQGTLTSRTQGYTPTPGKSPTLVPPGTLKLQFTAMDSVPAELQQLEAKK
jgi:hypothetical protein